MQKFSGPVPALVWLDAGVLDHLAPLTELDLDEVLQLRSTESTP
jgi:hypothetical protein